MRYLRQLSNKLYQRHDKLKNLQDLERSIDLRREQLQYTCDDYSARATCFMLLSIALSARFELNRDLADIRGSIQAADELVALTGAHDDKTQRLMYLDCLTVASKNRIPVFGRCTVSGKGFLKQRNKAYSNVPKMIRPDLKI